MADARLKFSRGATLDELRELFVSILGGLLVELIVVDRNGAIVSTTSKGLEVPSPGGENPHSELPSGPSGSELFFTRRKITTGKKDGLVLYVAAETTADRIAIERLSEVGAQYLARSLDRQEHAETLYRVIAEQKAVMDHISDGLLVLDSAGIVRHVNAPACRMLKLDARDCIGKPLTAILDFDLTIGKVFRTGEGYVDRELHIRSPRLDLHIMDTAVPILSETGAVISVVNTFQEMSRVKKLSNRMAGDRARYRFSDVLGHSRSIKEAIADGRRSARSDANVLLYGESGTGKEVFAQSIHNDGRRANGPFVAINCAALPRDLIESELFGYVPGSFTGADKVGRPGRFELASGGTIFLDEISEMPLDVQAKLLRVLQERQITRIGGAASIAIDVRVIVAANRDLKEMVSRSAFREDLFYRLDVIQIDMPPLRDRREDIPRLVDEFIRRSCAALHRPTIALAPAALSQLESYSWPGNIRQLQNVIERLVNMVDGDHVDSMPPDWLSAEPLRESPGPSIPLTQTFNLGEVEKQTILSCLEETGHNIAKSAEALGITRPTLYAKIRKYGLQLTSRLVQRA